MSFWSDASPVTKGAMVIAAVALLYLGIALAAGLPPFSEVEGATQERGLAPE